MLLNDKIENKIRKYNPTTTTDVNRNQNYIRTLVHEII